MSVQSPHLGTLKEYFGKFGPVSYLKLAKNKKNKDPLGFGFLEFRDDSTAQEVVSMKHYIGGREVISIQKIDVKPFKKGTEINKQDEDLKKRKLFVKGLPQTCSNGQLMAVFSKFGSVDKAFILFDHASGTSRGFGFVEFLDEAAVNRALATPVVIDGKTLKCSPAILKQESKPSPPEVKKIRIGTDDLHEEHYQSSNKIAQESKTKKYQQLKAINLKEDCYAEEGTRESSGNSSFDKYSKDNFGSPIVYSGYGNQNFEYMDHTGRSYETPLSIFQNQNQQPFFYSDLHFNQSLLFKNEESSRGHLAKPWPYSQVTADHQPLRCQAKSNKPSYYRMF